jgi:hypothetical protein
MDDVEALSSILALLKQLEPDAQRRVLHSVETFLGIAGHRGSNKIISDQLADDRSSGSPATGFSADRTISPKEFIRDKHPVTDVDRVTCLAYYLTHYRDTPQFKTIDISTLNTEAAQPKLSNASVAVDNATRDGYLVAAAKGNKQISAAGEKYVELLPDREAAKEALRTYRGRPRLRKRKTKNKTA